MDSRFIFILLGVFTLIVSIASVLSMFAGNYDNVVNNVLHFRPFDGTRDCDKYPCSGVDFTFLLLLGISIASWIFIFRPRYY
jgi:hypothetical protein